MDVIDSPPDVGTQLIILLAIVEKIDNSKKNKIEYQVK